MPKSPLQSQAVEEKAARQTDKVLVSKPYMANMIFHFEERAYILFNGWE